MTNIDKEIRQDLLLKLIVKKNYLKNELKQKRITIEYKDYIKQELLRTENKIKYLQN